MRVHLVTTELRASTSTSIHLSVFVEMDFSEFLVLKVIFRIIITVRKRSCGKVMFLQSCVGNSVYGRSVSQDALGETLPQADTSPGQTSPGRHPLGRHPPGRHPLPPGRHPWADTSPHHADTPWADTTPLRENTPLWADTPSPHQTDTPPPANNPPDGYCSGRYASYWDAFLSAHIFKTHKKLRQKSKLL